MNNGITNSVLSYSRGTGSIELQSSSLHVRPGFHGKGDRRRQGSLPRREEFVNNDAVLLETSISDLEDHVENTKRISRGPTRRLSRCSWPCGTNLLHSVSISVQGLAETFLQSDVQGSSLGRPAQRVGQGLGRRRGKISGFSGHGHVDGQLDVLYERMGIESIRYRNDIDYTVLYLP